MKRKIAVALIGENQIICEILNLSGVEFVMQDEFTPCNIPDEAVAMLPPPIEPYYCFLGEISLGKGEVSYESE